MGKIILGMTGFLAAGKGTVAKYLEEKHGATIYGFSAPLRDILDRLYLEQTRGNMQNLSTDLRNQFGADLLSSVIAKDVSEDMNNIIIVDGVRRVTDIKYLSALPAFHLINIEAEQKTRWKRMTKREQNPDDAQKTFEDFQQDELAEAEQQIAEVAAAAEYKLDNNGSMEEAEKQIEEILQKIQNLKSK